jgi:hypothetical protein
MENEITQPMEELLDESKVKDLGELKKLMGKYREKLVKEYHEIVVENYSQLRMFELILSEYDIATPPIMAEYSVCDRYYPMVLKIVKTNGLIEGYDKEELCHIEPKKIDEEYERYKEQERKMYEEYEHYKEQERKMYVCTDEIKPDKSHYFSDFLVTDMGDEHYRLTEKEFEKVKEYIINPDVVLIRYELRKNFSSFFDRDNSVSLNEELNEFLKSNPKEELLAKCHTSSMRTIVNQLIDNPITPNLEQETLNKFNESLDEFEDDYTCILLRSGNKKEDEWVSDGIQVEAIEEKYGAIINFKNKLINKFKWESSVPVKFYQDTLNRLPFNHSDINVEFNLCNVSIGDKKFDMVKLYHYLKTLYEAKKEYVGNALFDQYVKKKFDTQTGDNIDFTTAKEKIKAEFEQARIEADETKNTEAVNE